MKLIIKISILLAVLFLYSCSSSRSLTNCPKFKQGKNSIPKISEAKPSKARKKVAVLKTHSKKANRKQKRFAKKLNKLKSIVASNITGTDIRPPIQTQHKLETEVAGLDAEITDSDYKELAAQTASEKKVNNNKAWKKLKHKLPKNVRKSSPFDTKTSVPLHWKRPEKDRLKSKKRFLNKKPENPKDDKVEPLAILGLLFSVASFVAFGIIFGTAGAILGAIALLKISKNPTRRGRGLAILAIVIGVIAVILVAGYIAGM